VRASGSEAHAAFAQQDAVMSMRGCRDEASDQEATFRKKLLSAECVPEGALATALPYANETDLRETLENFRAYLSILRKWDQNERLDTENSSGQDGQVSVVDRELR
jgi:hypothetical protein